MSRTVDVHIGENARLIGRLHYNREGGRESSAFEYADDWLKDPEGFTIDPGLPRIAGPQFQRKTEGGSAFHGAIADTEPDGWGRRVISRDHAKRRQAQRRRGEEPPAAALDALDYLLAVDDFNRMGALRFMHEGQFQRHVEEGRRTPPLIELGRLLRASRAVETNTETEADLACLRGRGTSLGGRRPKCSIIDDDGILSIGKFPSLGDERAVVAGEVLALELAAKAGINAARAKLIESDGDPIAVIRRFDRVDGLRLDYMSAASLLGADPREDHAYTEIVDAIRIHGARPTEDIEELWRRMAFSVMINNVDDHLRNHGFLHADRDFWILSPAFDVNPFPDRDRELKTWISEDAGPEATVDALMSVVAYFGMTCDRAKAILGEVEAAVSLWRDLGASLGLSGPELDAFAPAFEHREREAARALA